MNIIYISGVKNGDAGEGEESGGMQPISQQGMQVARSQQAMREREMTSSNEFR